MQTATIPKSIHVSKAQVKDNTVKQFPLVDNPYLNYIENVFWSNGHIGQLRDPPKSFFHLVQQVGSVFCMALNHLENLLVLLAREINQFKGFIKLDVQFRNIWAICLERQPARSLQKVMRLLLGLLHLKHRSLGKLQKQASKEAYFWVSV